jgi:recombinational DNA repair ATPase RecF
LFAAESHADEEFPHLKPESQCPLCQQPLGVAATRLVAFDSFIQQEAEKSARDKKAKAVEAFNAIVKDDLAIVMDVELRTDIAAIDEELAKACDDFQNNLFMRRDAAKKASGDGNWDAIDAKPASPAPKLSMLATKLAEDATTLLKAADEKARTALESEFNELNDRLALFKAKAAVLDVIAKLAFVAKLKSCESDVRTNAISIKSNELNEQVVSKNLAETLNAEFKLLGVDKLHVDINTKVVKGKANHKLVLKLPGVPDAKLPKDILSEGEQRAIAIASFLAEVNIGQGRGGIVFDDPVSSLDHRRRELVAERIAAEAKKRQVIVFTHDVYFLCILQQEAENAAVPFMPLSLHKKPEGFGVADPSLPFEGAKTSARIGVLRQMQNECAKLHKIGDDPGYRKQARDTYFHLRLAWERAVEEVLFRNVVIRFREGIETNRLIETTVETSDFVEVNAGMTKCSKYAHDKAALGNIAIPGPEDVLQDINKLETWRTLLETRSKDTRKARSV